MTPIRILLGARVREQRREIECLYQLSRNLMLAADPGRLASGVAASVVSAFHAGGALYLDRSAARIYRAGAVEVPVSDQELWNVAIQGIVRTEPDRKLSILPVGIGGNILGSLAILGDPVSPAGLQAIANVAAIALERELAREAAAHAQVASSNAQLQAAIVDAIAHEFKTPLTSIIAAAHTLLGGGLDASAQRDLLDILIEDAGRLNTLVTEAIQLARVEIGDVRLERERLHIGDLIVAVTQQLRSLLDGRVVTVSYDPDLAPVDADPDRIALVLRQLLQNAARYTPPETPVEISAVNQGDLVWVSVLDHGAGIPPADLRRVFDRHYRGAQAKERVSGTGIGLAVSRQIVQAHGGSIWAENRPEGGACFTFTLKQVRDAIPR